MRIINKVREKRQAEEKRFARGQWRQAIQKANHQHTLRKEVSNGKSTG